MWLTTQRNLHLVQMPNAANRAPERIGLSSKVRAELVDPGADGRVAHHHAALKQQRFDIAQAELGAEIPAHSAANDSSRKAVAAVE